MRFLIACGLVCILVFSLAHCDEMETEYDNEVTQDIFEDQEDLPVIKSTFEKQKARKSCGHGFWCNKN